MPPEKSTHNNNKRKPIKPESSSLFSATDVKLGKKLGLSKSEFYRYKQLDMLVQSMLTPKLVERNDLNHFVILHLGEKISPHHQFTALVKFLIPTEHALRYALQKVNNIEEEINQLLTLHDILPLFDDNTTKKHRVELLLKVALDYKQSLSQYLNAPHKHDQLQQKLKNLALMIAEFKEQLRLSNFTIHNNALYTLPDRDIQYFLSKLKAIGVAGTSNPEAIKKSFGFFKIKLLGALFKSEDKDSPQNDDTPIP